MPLVGPVRTIDVALFDMAMQLSIVWESVGAELTDKMILNVTEKVVHTISIVVRLANVATVQAMPVFDVLHQGWERCATQRTTLIGRHWTNMSLLGASDLPTTLAPVIALLMNLEAVEWEYHTTGGANGKRHSRTLGTRTCVH